MDGVALLRQSQDVGEAEGNGSGVRQPLNGGALGEGGEGRIMEGRDRRRRQKFPMIQQWTYVCNVVLCDVA